MSVTVPVIGGLGYAFPAGSRSVRELHEGGLLQSEPELLERFGFGRVFVAVEETPYDLARRAAEQVLAERDIDPSTVDLLIYGGTPGTLAFAAPEEDQGSGPFRTTDRFKYPGTRLQYELGLDRASVFGLEQLACITMFSALRLARALCLSEGLDRVLCVTSEFFPANAGREAIYNCTSDAACAVLVERNGTGPRLVGGAQVTKGYYWDADAQKNEIIASYFPTSKHVIERALACAGWSADQVDWVIPHNVSRRSWDILLGLLKLPRARLWGDNIARHGHTLAGDNFINLRDALTSGAIRAGQRLLLFSYGYGAHWAALAVEA